MSGELITTRQAAEILGVKEWQVRRLFEVGDLVEAPKFGGKRIIRRDQLASILAGLCHRGWLSTESAVGTQAL